MDFFNFEKVQLLRERAMIVVDSAELLHEFLDHVDGYSILGVDIENYTDVECTFICTV
jgi:predicted alpha-1,6-mannanase (GH76 family)